MDIADEKISNAVELCGKFVIMFKNHRFDQHVLSMNLVDLSVLHRVVCLAADHPGFQDLSPQTKDKVARFREFCVAAWIQSGLTVEEAAAMDDLRTEADDE